MTDTEMNDRRLPVGIQSFEVIRKDGYLYVDKTDMVWRLAHSNKTYHYLSRPRRFGKSILVDTLQAYFEGTRSLRSCEIRRHRGRSSRGRGQKT